MKKYVCCFLFILFTFVNIAFADTETVNWYVDGNLYQTTYCQTGNDIILPVPPTKQGYDFQGWQTYSPVEYLETNGLQKIQTDVVPPDNYLHGKVGLFAYKVLKNRLISSALGHNLGLGAGQQTYLWSGPNSNELDYISCANVYCDIEYIISSTGRSLIINGNTRMENISLSFNSGKFYMFNKNYPFSGKIYYYKLFDKSDNLILDLVPAVDGDGTPCMVDKIEGKIYYNTGTDSFVAGPSINQNISNLCGSIIIAHAIFQPNTVTLNFDDDNGHMTQTSCVYDGLINLPPDPAQRPGYRFSGWKLITGE